MSIITTPQNLSAISYARRETLEIRNGAVVTCNATPTTRPGNVQCTTSGKFRLENSSPTVPLIFDLDDPDNDFRFEAGATFEVRGAPMTLGVGNGAAQTFDFTTLFGGGIRHMTYVRVDYASGLTEIWPVIDEDPKFLLDCGVLTTTGGAAPSNFTAGNAPAGRVFFWHETNRTLRCGGGVNGAAVPAGATIKIPNIYVSNRLVTNATRVLGIELSGGVTGGTFTLTFRNEAGTLLGTTAAIAWNATAAAIDTAIESVTGVGTVTAGSGPLPAAVSITWAGALTTGFGNIPSVAVGNNSLTGTNPQVVLRENSAANLSFIDLSPLGNFDAEWCSFSNKIRFSNSGSGNIRIRDCGFGADTISINDTNGTIDIDGLSHTAGTFTTTASGTIQNAFGAAITNRIARAQKSPTALCNWVNTPNLQSPVINPVTIHYGKRSSTGNRGMQFITVPPNLTILDAVIVGNPMQLTNANDMRLVRPLYADGTGNVQETPQAVSPYAQTNCVNLIIANPGSAGPMAARGLLTVPDATTSNIQVYGAELDFANNGDRPVYLGGAGAVYQNMKISNIRSGPLIDNISNWSANGSIVKKVFGTYATAPANGAGLDASTGGIYDMVSATVLGITRAFSGVSDFVGGNYTDPSLTPTTGHVTFGPIGSGRGLEVTGACYTDALGSLFMPSAGDVAVLTLPFNPHGITSFQNAVPRIFLNAPQAPTNTFIAQSFPAATGGAVTFTIATEAGVVLGTTAAIAFNASTTTTRVALEAIPGIGTGNTSVGGNMSSSYTVTFTGALAGQRFIVTMDSSALTGPAGMVSYVAGSARLLDGTEGFGSNLTAQFAVRVPNASWSAYSALTAANLAAAISALTNYSAGQGLEIRIRLEALQTNELTRVTQISLLTNVNPDLWVVNDAKILLQGPAATDIVRVFRLSDDVEIYTFTGGGNKEFTVGNNFGAEVYFMRESATGRVLMTSYPATKFLGFGDNGIEALFYGSEVQLAESSEIADLAKETTAQAIKTKTDQLIFNGQGHVAANVHQLQAGALTDIANAVEGELAATEFPKLKAHVTAASQF
jgi:hypothetical protein